jgi:hypothetical protein
MAEPTFKADSKTGPIPVSPRVCLVPLATVRAMHGYTAEEVAEVVESGKYLWVWDFSRGRGRNRCLRFWFDELSGSSQIRELELADVIALVLPKTRAWFAPGEVCRRFTIDRTGLMHLRRALALKTGNVRREPLAKYLASRWIGGGQKARR